LVFKGSFVFVAQGKLTGTDRKLVAFILDEILPQSLRGVTTKM